MLEKTDLKAIEKLIDKRANTTEKSLEKSLKGYVDRSNAKQELNLKDYVNFTIEKSEQRTDLKLDKMATDIKDIKHNIEDMIETNQKFLEVLGNHEGRIQKLETATEKC